MKRFWFAASMLVLGRTRSGHGFGATRAVTLAALMSLGLCSFGAEAATARITQWNLPPVASTTIGINVRVDSSGASPVVWATTGQSNPQLIRFDPSARAWKAWNLSLSSGPQNAGGIALAPDGKVFVKTRSDVQRLDPSQNIRTVWNDPFANNAGSDIALAPDGSVWSAVGSDPSTPSVLQRLLPSGVVDANGGESATITRWSVSPSGEITLAGIRVHPNGKIYFAMNATWRIGEFDPATNQLRSWPVNAVGAQAPRQIDIDAAGAIWAVTATNHIVRLRADSNEMTRFDIPTPAANPYGITAQGADGRIAFTELGARKIGLLEPVPAFTATVQPAPFQPLQPNGATVIAVPSGVVPTTGSAQPVPFDRAIGQSVVAGSLFNEVDVYDVTDSPLGIDRDRSNPTPAYFYAGLSPLINHVTFDLAGASTPNLIQNGSFELGLPPSNPCNTALDPGSTAIPGWTVVAGNIEWVDGCAWQASDGTHSLDLVGTGNIGGVQQTIATVPGATYRLSFDLAGNFGTATGSPPVKPLAVTVARATGGLDPLAGNGATHTYNFDFRQTSPAPPYGSIVAAIRARSPTLGNNLTVDFFSEPNSMGLIYTYNFSLDNPLDVSLSRLEGLLTDGVFSIGIRSSAPATLEGLSVTGNPSTSAAVPGPFSVFTYVPFGDTTRTYTFDTSSRGPTTMGWEPKTFDFYAETSATKLTFVSDMTMLAGGYAGAAIDNVRVVRVLPVTTTSLQSSSSPAAAGSSVTFTALVAGTNPTGTVTFTDGGVIVAGCGAVPLVGGGNMPSTATCVTSSLTAGSHGIAASYIGDANNASSTSNLLLFQVNGGVPGAPTIGIATAGNTQISVAFTPPTSDGGSAITSYTANCGGASAIRVGAPIVVSGLTNGTVYTCTVRAANINGMGPASAPSNSVTPIPASPWASSVGDVKNGGPGTGSSVDLTPPYPGTTIPSSPTVISDGTAGTAAVFTYATVNSYCCHNGDWTFETTAPTSFTTGDVVRNWLYAGYHGTCSARAKLTAFVRRGGVIIYTNPVYSAFDVNCQGNLPNGGFGQYGQAVFPNVAAGDTYGFMMHAGNYDSNGGVQGRLTVTTGTLPTSTALASSASQVPYGTNVTFTATVAGVNPTGTVTITQEGRFIVGCEAIPVVGGVAACTYNGLAAGNRNMVALYSGDVNNAGSTGTLSQIINPPAPPVLATPVLIRAAPFGVVPPLIGRVDGGVNTPITVRLFSGTSCTNGVLGGTFTPIGTDGSVTTDANGYFGTQQTGLQGQFVAVGIISPQVTPLSNCVVSAADNDTWPKALPLVGDSVTVPDWIDAAGKARWYRFSVLPGQSIQVAMSGLPADYDLAVFKDIAVEFRNELVPTTTADLTRLSAQYAPSAFSPSAFSPSAFSPSAFSPSAFSPSAFSPSAFSPSAFSPSAFSPSAFSPSAFSPSAFSPSAFSPSAFSPSAFSPSAFSPSAFSPSAFSPTELQQAFSAAQTRSIIAASMTPGTGDESVVVNTWNNTGNFYVRVTGRAGAFSPLPYSLAVSKQGTSCTTVTNTAISTRPAMTAGPNGGYNTIILIDSSKTPRSAPVPGLPNDTLGSKLDNFVTRSEVKGVIVDVATDGRVGTLKAQAMNNVGCPFAKNLVALEIRSIIDAYRMNNPLRYVVIIGNDDAIPFFRYADQTLLGKESGYVPPVSSASASDASLRGNFVLTQDHYGATNSISLGASEFPIPGMAVGRLIETPAEIAGMIDAYVQTNGSVSPSSSLVTGYDFLQDAAEAVRDELQLGTGRLSDSLITPNTVSPADLRPYSEIPGQSGPWTAADLGNKLLNARHDLMFLAGHFSANSALAADFKTSVMTSDLAASSLPNNFTNALVFSAGCHSGYNIVDTDGIPGVTFPLDWAQAWAQQKATLVAGTGYQYGDTDFIEYSERLYLNFAKELRAGTVGTNVAIGDALVKAKLAYLKATPDLRGLHEKAVLEATLFGLPMLGVNMPAGRTGLPTTNGVINAQPPSVPSLATSALGLRVAGLAVSSPSLTAHPITLTNYDALPVVTTTTATYLSGPDGVVTNPAEPALPLQIVNVTPLDSRHVLRGVGFDGGRYSDSTVIPLTGAPATELRGVHTPFSSPVFFPMRLWTSNYFSALAAGAGMNLLVTPAQHRAVDATNSTLRQYSSLGLRLFYSDLTSVAAANQAAFLSDAPTIVRISASSRGTVTAFFAQVVGDPAAGVHQVWVTYTDGVGGNGFWTSLDLKQCAPPSPAVCGTTADSQVWKGEIATPADTRYIVQAASGTGLVSMDDNFGRYYSIVASAPAPTATVMSVTAPAATAVYGSSLSITALLSSISGSPVAGKVVTIAAGGGAVTGTTDSSGSVTVLLPMTAAPGSYPLSASFGGDSAYLPSSATTTTAVTVTKATPTLTAPATGAVGAVLRAGSRPLIQESIQFLVTGPLGTQQLSAVTDYSGTATIPPPGLPSGTYVVNQACFAGNATYAAATLNSSSSAPPCNSISSYNTYNPTLVAASKAATTKEDTPKTITLSATGADSGTMTFAIGTIPTKGVLGTIPSASCLPAGAGIMTCSADVRYTPNGYNGPDSFTYTAKNSSATSLPATVYITVSNAVPVITSLTGPAAPVSKGTAVTITANFTDAGSLDTHTCTFAWGDGLANTVSAAGAGNGSCTTSHSYATAGVYTPQVIVTDNDGGSTSSTLEYVVVYDASAGFVTGGGWINSPSGAYAANANLTGKASFGFVSKYTNGSSVPTGKTEFNFHVANFKFNSTAYEWLVISGAKAQYKGTGTINGAGRYNFILTVVDGDVNGGGGIDKFRIRIYSENQGNQMIYDNQLGAPDQNDPTTALGGGSIVIHK